MSSKIQKDLQNRWIAEAHALDGRGYFVTYAKKQREEVLRKGYLGAVPPDLAISIALRMAEQGYDYRTAKFNDEMRELFHVVGQESREMVLRLLSEIPPESYWPPFEIKEPPGYPFVFRSSILDCLIYFKFQILGTTKKPNVLFWSCDPAHN